SLTSPSFVNLQALLKRLSRICRSRMGSTINAPRFSWASTTRRFLFCSASCPAVPVKLPMQEFPQSVPNITEASQNLYELIRSRNIISYPDADIRLAISRAVAVEGARGWKISKEKAAHKIDVVVALGMAALAAA